MLSFPSAIHQTLLPTPLWYKYGLCDQTSGYFSLTCSWLTGGAAAVVKCLARDQITCHHVTITSNVLKNGVSTVAALFLI